MSNVKRRFTQLRVRGALIGLLVVALLFGGGSAAYAYWSASNAHAGSAIARVDLPQPASISCQNQGLWPLATFARVSWAQVPGADGYLVVVTRASGGAPFEQYQTSRQIDLTEGVLGDLLSGLLNPTTLTVRVYPAINAGTGGIWESPNTVAHTASAVLLPIGSTCGSPVA